MAASEKYSKKRIDMLKEMLDREAGRGKGRDYEISIDGIKVVTRTNDPEEFYNFERDLTDDVENLTIVIYEYNNQRNQVYSFACNFENSIPSAPVNGLGALGAVEEMMNQKIKERDNHYRLERLQEKLADTEQKLGEAEECIDVLKSEIELAKTNKFSLNGVNIMEVCGEVVRHVIFSNAGKSPVLAQVAGALGALTPSPALPSGAPPELPQEEATFREGSASPQLNERQAQILASIQQMENKLKGGQLMVMNGIIIRLMECPDELATVAELLNIKIPGYGKA